MRNIGKEGSSVAFAATDRIGCFWKSRRSLRGARTGKMRDFPAVRTVSSNVRYQNRLEFQNKRAVIRNFGIVDHVEIPHSFFLVDEHVVGKAPRFLVLRVARAVETSPSH